MEELNGCIAKMLTEELPNAGVHMFDDIPNCIQFKIQNTI
jgi:hypothetical protein